MSGGEPVDLPRAGEVVVVVARRDPLRCDPALLSAIERDRAGSMAHPRSRDRFVGGRCLARTLLSAMIDALPQDVEIDVGPDGIVLPAGKAAGLHLSISHGATHDAVAVAQSPVGIDIEEDAPPDLAGLAETVMSANELAAFHRLPAAGRAHAFLALWTRKEAVLKAAGRGFLVDPRSVETFWGPGLALSGGPGLAQTYAVSDVPAVVPLAVALAGQSISIKVAAA